MDTEWLREDEREMLKNAINPQAGDDIAVAIDTRTLLSRLVAEREKNAELLREASRIIGLLKSSLAKVREENAAFREQMLQVARDADAKIVKLRENRDG